MGFLSKFEGRMEDTFEGAADKMAHAPISPVQIAKKAEKMMRREKMVGAGKQYAPTLYTVLVNAEDDERLFGYYPTLAGETETYLAAKAVEDGLVMDGQPLVRFIVDDGLRHGKFDVIAEAVAAPLIAQLRAEEMHRYGIGGPAAGGAAMGGAAAMAAGREYAAPAGGARAGAGAPYGDPYAVASADPYGAPANSYTPPVAYDLFDEAAVYGGPTSGDPYAPNGAYPQGDPYAAGDPYAPGAKPPLPYVPEDEIDYSIDYGDYTFNSQDFDDYRERGVDAVSLAGRDAAGFEADAAAAGMAGMGAAAGLAGAAGMAGAGAARAAGAPSTVVFAAGAGGASPQPNAQAVRARLVDTTNNRTFALATARLIVGRENSCDIVLPDINASRTHAELRFEPQGVWSITDLGSTNGTFVNGRQVSTQALRAGDRIVIGMTNLVFDRA